MLDPLLTIYSFFGPYAWGHRIVGSDNPSANGNIGVRANVNDYIGVRTNGDECIGVRANDDEPISE